MVKLVEGFEGAEGLGLKCVKACQSELKWLRVRFNTMSTNRITANNMYRDAGSAVKVVSTRSTGSTGESRHNDHVDSKAVQVYLCLLSIIWEGGQFVCA
jgi:hypothetical protein